MDTRDSQRPRSTRVQIAATPGRGADPAAMLDLPAPPRASLGAATKRTPLPARLGLLLIVVLAHFVALRWIGDWSGRAAAVRPSPPLRGTWIERVAVAPPPPSPARSRPREAATPPPRPRMRTRGAPPDRDPGERVETQRAAEAPRLRLYRMDGSLDLPASALADLERVTAGSRRFSHQVPGLMETLAAVPRPQALPYEATRFEEDWAETTDIVTEGLAKAVEKTTATVRIPVPGSPGTTIVCGVSLAALAGGCGIVNIGDRRAVELDDPDTLSPEEARACAQLWDSLVQAGSTAQWQRARDRYEAECRKPLAAGNR